MRPGYVRYRTIAFWRSSLRMTPEVHSPCTPGRNRTHSTGFGDPMITLTPAYAIQLLALLCRGETYWSLVPFWLYSPTGESLPGEALGIRLIRRDTQFPLRLMDELRVGRRGHGTRQEGCPLESLGGRVLRHSVCYLTHLIRDVNNFSARAGNFFSDQIVASPEAGTK